MTMFNNLVIDIPAIVLVILLGLTIIVMWLAQRRADFDFAQMLTDDSGKPSAMRLAVLISVSVTSWVLIKLTMTATDTDKLFNFFASYLAIWSGAKIMEKLMDVLILKFGGKQ